MFDEQTGFCIPKNHPTTILKALDQYAENAFNDVAQYSELYGQEIAGFLYSPYFFRRFIPIQFMEGLTRWKEDGKLFPLVEYLAKAVKINSAANRVFGNPKDSRIVPFKTPAHIKSNVPFEPTKDVFEQLYSKQYYYGSIYRYPRAFRIVYELKESGYSEEQITRILTDFADSPREPVKIGIWVLKPAKVSVKHRYCNNHNEVAYRAYQNGANSLSAKIIDSLFDYVNEIGIFSPTSFCRIVDVDGRSFMEFARLTNGVYWNAFLNELKTLAILEQKNDFVFEERKNFLPLSMLQSIPVNGELSYQSALAAVMEGEGALVAEEIAFSEDFRLCFLRAGIYYTIKNRVAFEGGNYHGTTELSMALNAALADVLALDSEEALETFAEKEFSDSSTPVQGIGIARQVEAFGSDSGFETAKQVDAFSSSKSNTIPKSATSVNYDFSSMADAVNDVLHEVTDEMVFSPRPSGSGKSQDFLNLGRPKMPEHVSDRKPRGIRIEKCIINSDGVNAYVGDTVKMNLLVTTGWGNEGKITAINDDHIVLDDGVVQPLEGILDFKITSRISKVKS